MWYVCERTAYQCMNEVVIDRGPDSHLCSLECYCDGLLITTIQADGVIISSTTGSTAYSLSAGGTMCHPIVPAVCFTPICPHSLSCRPIMFPDSVTLRIQVCDAPHTPHAPHTPYAQLNSYFCWRRCRRMRAREGGCRSTAARAPNSTRASTWSSKYLDGPFPVRFLPHHARTCTHARTHIQAYAGA